MKNIVFVITGFLLLYSLVFLPSLYAKQTTPLTDPSLLQRLSNMEYEDAVKELEGMEPEPYIHHIMGLSAVWSQKDDPRMTKMYLDLALLTARSNKKTKNEAIVLYFYARFLDSRSMLEEAIGHVSKAVKILGNEDDKDMLKECLSLKANLEHRRGDYRASMNTQKELLRLSSAKGDELLRAHSMYEIALLHYKLGYPKKGIQDFKDALAVFEMRGHQKGMGDCLKALGNAASAEGDKKNAESYYLRASEEYRKANATHGEANCLFNLGILFRDQRLFDKSIDSLQEAIAAYTQSSSVTGVGIANMEMGRTYFMRGNNAKAETHFVTAQKLLTRSRNFRRLAQAEEYLAELKEAQGAMTEVIQYRESAVSHYEKVNLPADAARVRKLLNASVAQNPNNKTSIDNDR